MEEKTQLLRERKPSPKVTDTAISQPTKQQASNDVAKYVTVLLAGFVFGTALNKGRVFEPGNIFEQMLFFKWIMFKMFFCAVAASQLALALLSVLPSTRNSFEAAVNEYASCCTRGLPSAGIGAFILGVGMSVAGSCPGNVFVQVGAGIQNSGFTLLGGFVGGAVYSLVEPQIASKVLCMQPIVTETFMHRRLNMSFWKLAVPVAFVLISVVAIIEHFVPWNTEVGVKDASPFLLYRYTDFAWAPALAGCLIGSMQIPLVLAIRDTAGGSSAFMTVLSTITPAMIREKSAYLAKYRHGLGNWWQVVYLSGGMLGSLSAAYASGSIGYTVNPMVMTPMRMFWGGFLMLFGARMAAGCTSGHGISGLGLLNVNSMVAVCAMFGGGIATAVVMYFAGWA
eukprot:comp6807_c0_seq1/m.2549 comp6807_c0_seq1/g.2549  ORF comp6807_c0_seq1/g.2549 comp6807_c0_seq1/m.2549 type:complete len:396 (-) comp6807_c0_seq1:61-1248(-)